MNEITWVDIVNVIINGLIAIVALLALIFSFIYFNKRLKFYCHEKINTLKITACDKGNGSCRIIAGEYYLDKQKNNKTKIEHFENNEVLIDLEQLKFTVLRLNIIDNYGRKYKVIYKGKGDKWYE